MAGGAVAGRAHVQSARPGFCIVNQLTHGFDGQLVAHHQGVLHRTHQRNAGQGIGVIGKLGVKRFVDGQCHHVAITQRVAIGGGACNLAHAQCAAGAGFVVHDDGLAQRDAELVAQQSANHVGRAACS